MSGADSRMDRGRVRRGSRTSSPRMAESSSPAKAKAIEAQRLSAVRSPRSGTSDRGVIGVAGSRVNAA